jgi:hypothetical protein
MRPDKRWVAGVEDGGRQPRSNAEVWCLLSADLPCDFRASMGGDTRRRTSMRTVAAGDVTRLGDGDP